MEDAIVAGADVETDTELRHEIRVRALQAMDSIHAGTLDLTLLEPVGPLIVAMRPGGWLALDMLCRAKFRAGIRRIVFPASLVRLRHSELLLAKLDQLQDLQTIEYAGGSRQGRSHATPGSA